VVLALVPEQPEQQMVVIQYFLLLHQPAVVAVGQICLLLVVMVVLVVEVLMPEQQEVEIPQAHLPLKVVMVEQVVLPFLTMEAVEVAALQRLVQTEQLRLLVTAAQEPHHLLPALQ
jgi:hypothetical protein